MTTIKDIQQAMVEREETLEAYWRELDGYALKIRHGFADHLDVEKTGTWRNEATKETRPLLDLGYRDPEALLYEKPSFIPLRQGENLPGKDSVLSFVLCLAVKSPQNPNYTQLLYLDLFLKRDGNLITLGLTGSDDDFDTMVSREEFDALLPSIYEGLAKRIMSSLDASKFK